MKQKILFDLKKYYIFFILFIVQGCFPPIGIVQGTKTVHHKFNSIEGNIYIAKFSEDENYDQDSVFNEYVTELENYFFGYGFRVVDDINEADYVGFISYGIGEPITNTYSVPIYRERPKRTYTLSDYDSSTNTISYTTYTEHTMPEYEIIGYKTESYVTYDKNFAMDIVSVDSVLKQEPAKKVYEGRIKSSGACNSVNAVMSELLQIMFQDFPGTQGTNNVDVYSVTTPYCATN